MDEALSSLDFSMGEKADMWRLLAAILHSGDPPPKGPPSSSTLSPRVRFGFRYRYAKSTLAKRVMRPAQTRKTQISV